jgi:hypothetical protein
MVGLSINEGREETVHLLAVLVVRTVFITKDSDWECMSTTQNEQVMCRPGQCLSTPFAVHLLSMLASMH